MPDKNRQPRLLFVVTEDWYFVSHRLPLAIAARKAGYEVFVATRLRAEEETIRNAGLIPIPLKRLRRSGRNPFIELIAVAELAGIFRRVRPDIVNAIAMKPVIYGAIAARLAGIRRFVATFAGLGLIFSSASQKARLTRPLFSLALRMALAGRGRSAIVQNPDDADVLRERVGIPAEKMRLIRGSGVDPARYLPAKAKTQPPIVLLASRMIWDKGIADFAHAADQAHSAGIKAQFLLAGAPDEENPNAVPLSVLEGYNHSGALEWLGQRNDIPEIMAGASIVCLPSTYGEGVPKALIEAAASECALVAYDIPGCRDIVRDGENGLLVPRGDVKAFTDALITLIGDTSRIARMGRTGRKLVKDAFSEEKVISETLGLYAELL